MDLPKNLTVGQMTYDEARTLGQWAADEGWNPGLHDIDIAWNYDPDAFIALREGSEFVGGGSIIAYGTAAGFMGLFIVRSDVRQRGLGAVLWHERLRRLRARLDSDAHIGMDGVFDMVPFYEKGGFTFLHRDLRYEGIAQGETHPASRPLNAVPFEQLAAFDAHHFETERAAFLKSWLANPDGNGTVLLDGDTIVGYGYVRRCLTGYKVGPSFASGPHWGKPLLQSLFALIPGEPVQVDIPEPNEAAVNLLEDWGFRQSFGCARLTHGPAPALPLQCIFGITSFEFG